MWTHSLIALLPLVAQLASAEDAFFIIQQGGALLTSRLDSIINPGGVSGHQHAIVGASNFDPSYDYDNLLKSKCQSGNVDIDFSNYWAPQLYRKVDGGVKLIPLSYSNTYYLLRRQPDDLVHEFPPGFRMMAGSAGRTTYDESNKAETAISYVCLGVDGPETPGFPAQRCPNGMRAQAFFPNCWDGKNNWLAGNKHVSYPAEGPYNGGGKCPDTHPNRIFSLFYEWIYHDNEEYEAGARVWANGDDVGYSFHADFVNGWPEGTFTEILSHGSDCNVGFSLEKCPFLKPHMQDSGKCQYEGILVDEDIGLDVIPALPDNNPFWNANGAQPAAGYVESALFVRANDNSTKIAPPGPGTQYQQIDAGDDHIASVRGDASYTGPTLISGNGATNGVVQTSTGTAATATTSSSSQATQTDIAVSSTASPVPSSIIGGPALVAGSGDTSKSSATPAASSTRSSTCHRGKRRMVN